MNLEQTKIQALAAYGDETIHQQILSSDLELFDSSFGTVFYRKTRFALVAAGSPLCPPADRRQVFLEFQNFAKSIGRRVIFCGVEDCTWTLSGFLFEIGKTPYWNSNSWGQKVANKSTLRSQINRAKNKGASIVEINGKDLLDNFNLIAELKGLYKIWKNTLGPLSLNFTVNPDPFLATEYKNFFIAHRSGRVDGFASCVSNKKHSFFVVESLVRHPLSANGVSELLIDAIFQSCPRAGNIEKVSLGLVPLAFPQTSLMKGLRKLGNFVYSFRGLENFRSKLDPDIWQKTYLWSPTHRYLSLGSLAEALLFKPASAQSTSLEEKLFSDAHN